MYKMCDMRISYVSLLVCFFFFFKQKTAYEMRISDWSSRRVLFRSVDGAVRTALRRHWRHHGGERRAAGEGGGGFPGGERGGVGPSGRAAGGRGGFRGGVGAEMNAPCSCEGRSLGSVDKFKKIGRAHV